jgi:murein tripeptide amidase MpaA
MRHALSLALCLIPCAAAAGDAARRAGLPPELPWSGLSRALALPPDHPWATPFEKSGLLKTPRYDETTAWLRRLAANGPELQLVSLGRSPEGRELWMVVVSREGASTAEALRANGKPTLLAQAGIHAGEIDGKDAGLMLLRDIVATKSRAALLDRANLLLVPIFNVDGHERFSAFTRINQRGPAEAGWRTTARNLNLNRDYTKADAPEMRSMLRALNDWQPDLYIDLHVTDGADYQYDVTYGRNGESGASPAIGAWLDTVLFPSFDRDLSAMGHIPGPLVFLVDDTDPKKGILAGTAGPRFSTGYGDVRHLPTILVENHSLKPYPQRVFGMYVLLESALRALGAEGERLRAAAAQDRARRRAEIPLDWKPDPATRGELDFKAVAWTVGPSAASGGPLISWLGTPLAVKVPRIVMVPAAKAVRPRAYWVPPAWSEVVERLELHGIRVERAAAATDVDVEMIRIVGAKLGAPFEGRVPVTGDFVPERRRERFPAGSARVSLDQPLGDLAALLLEPASPDSFLQWGFFLEVLQPTEYAETYIMGPTGERMLAEDAALRAEFERKLAEDPAFARDPALRLGWLHGRTPFHDDRHLLYPVGRELER